MLNRLLSKFRAARIVRGLPDENGWMNWHLVAGPGDKQQVLYEISLWEASASMRRFALTNFREIARQHGYHLHPDDLREFGLGIDLTETRPAPKDG
jgi:hypothetical protein